MNFEEFYLSKTYKSDKGTAHDYINSFYNKEFTDIRNDSIKIVEIGIFEGNSLRLFGEWFLNGTIIGIDNGKFMKEGWKEKVMTIPNTTAIFEDAYSDDIVNQFEDESLDYVIDDGPHTHKSQIMAYQKWFKKIKKGGKLIIEDINGVSTLSNKFTEIGVNFEIYDTRKKTNKGDDVLFVFKK